MTTKKTALVTGLYGQDGHYLAELLIEKGYEVHGLTRRPHPEGVPVLNVTRHMVDICDKEGIYELIMNLKPCEVYNLAAQSQVAQSFTIPAETCNTNSMGTLNLLEAIRRAKLEGVTKFYQASSSELFGKVSSFPQDETTPFYPRSPYAVSKLFSYWITVNYREAYSIFCCNGILFNHESPMRDIAFVTRKITHAAVRISKGLQDCLFLGNLNALRDWGHAKDYVEAMWMMMQTDQPGDYIVASGETHSVRQFAESAFREVGITIQWAGSGVDETGTDTATGKVVVRVDKQFFRPTDVTSTICGNTEKIRKATGWVPKINFNTLVGDMVAADMKLVGAETQQ